MFLQTDAWVLYGFVFVGFGICLLCVCRGCIEHFIPGRFRRILQGQDKENNIHKTPTLLPPQWLDIQTIFLVDGWFFN